MNPRFSISRSPLVQRFLAASSWSLAGSFGIQAFALISAIVIARTIGRQAYGEVAIVVSTIGLTSGLAQLELGQAVSRSVAASRANDEIAGRNFLGFSYAIAGATSLTFSLILFLGAPLISRTLLAAPAEVGVVLRLACPLVLFNTMNDVQLAVLAGVEAFDAVARLRISRGALTTICLLCGTWLAGFQGYVLGWLLSAITMCWLSQRAINRHSAAARFSPKADFSADHWRVLARFCSPAILSGFVVTAVTWLANAHLVKQAGGYGEMGLFNAANQPRTALLLLSSFLAQPLLPMLSNLRRTSHSAYTRLLRIAVLTITGITAAAALAFGLGAGYFAALFGKQFGGMTHLILLLVLTAVAAAPSSVIGEAIASEDRMWHGFWLNALWASMFGALCWRLIPAFRAEGLAVAFLVSYLLHGIAVACYYTVVYRSDLKLALSTAATSGDHPSDSGASE